MDKIITVELHGPIEAYALVMAIEAHMNACTDNDDGIVQFFALKAIATRMAPQVDALVAQEKTYE